MLNLRLTSLINCIRCKLLVNSLSFHRFRNISATAECSSHQQQRCAEACSLPCPPQTKVRFTVIRTTLCWQLTSTVHLQSRLRRRTWDLGLPVEEEEEEDLIYLAQTMTITIVNRTLGPMCKVTREPVAKLSEFERIKTAERETSIQLKAISYK